MKEGRGQAGFSLVEVLICLMLAGTIVMAIAYGMLTLMRVNSSTSQRQQIQLALGSFTENLLVAPYLPCSPSAPVQPTPNNYNSLPGLWRPKPGMTAVVTKVEFWDESVKKFVSSCPAGLDQGTQRLNVKVDWRGRSGTAQIVTSYRPEPTP